MLPLFSKIAPVIGIVVIILVLQDVFEVLLLPRRVSRSRRIASTVLRPIWRVWRRLAGIFGPGFRPVFLSWFGPLSVVFLYLIWATCLIGAYAICEWGANFSSPHRLSIGGSLYLSGSSFFTLGLGDVTPHTRLAKIFLVIEAANGFGLVAAVIGYLPVLYQSFSRREAHVIRLDARAGSPPSAVFMLSQHGDGEAMLELMDFLRQCEEWAASVVEGQLSFPMLAFYRSHHDNQSWLAALCTIMDACAVLLTGFEGVKNLQPRMSFAVGRMAILEMINILRLPPIAVPADRLPALEFALLSAALRNADLRWCDGDAEARLAKLRSTYEPYLHAIAQYLVLPLPGWVPSAERDNWQSGHDGTLARKLIDLD
jgi:hypothetical protein